MGSSPSDPQGRTKKRPPTQPAKPPTQLSIVPVYAGPIQPSATPAQLSIVSAYDGPTPPPRLEGGLSVNPALGVSPRSQTDAINRVRPRKVGGQTAYRATAKLSTTSESRRKRFVGSSASARLATTVQRVGEEPGATTRRARRAPRPDDRTPVRGHADLPYLQDSSGGPPAIVASGSPAARLATTPVSAGGRAPCH